MVLAYEFLFDLALLATIAIVGWCALDVWLDPARRRRLACVGTLSVAAFAWSAGTLLLVHADTPAAVLAARRVLFAGVCLLPAAWVWCALVAAHPHALAQQRRRFLAMLMPGLAVYACLYVAPGAFKVALEVDGTVIDTKPFEVRNDPASAITLLPGSKSKVKFSRRCKAFAFSAEFYSLFMMIQLFMKLIFM